MLRDELLELLKKEEYEDESSQFYEKEDNENEEYDEEKVKEEAQNIINEIVRALKQNGDYYYHFRYEIYHANYGEELYAPKAVIREVVNYFIENGIPIYEENECLYGNLGEEYTIDFMLEKFDDHYDSNAYSNYPKLKRLKTFLEYEAECFNSIINNLNFNYEIIIKRMSFPNMIYYDSFMCALYRAGYDTDSCYKKYNITFQPELSQAIRNCIEISHKINKEKNEENINQFAYHVRELKK